MSSGTGARDREVHASREISLREVLTKPLPHLENNPLTRLLCRAIMAGFRHQAVEISGIEHIGPERDPFILVLNHNIKLESIVLPTLLVYHRNGRLIHFIADWNFCLIPGVSMILRASQPVIVVQKDARPRFLNVFKPLYRDAIPAFGRLRRRVESGASVGIFPEGTTNSDPMRMLRGHPGAARLSLQTGVPIVPAGIRFPFHASDKPIGVFARYHVEIGEPMLPPACELPGKPRVEEVRRWHCRIMHRLAGLSGKEWEHEAEILGLDRREQ